MYIKECVALRCSGKRYWKFIHFVTLWCIKIRPRLKCNIDPPIDVSVSRCGIAYRSVLAVALFFLFCIWLACEFPLNLYFSPFNFESFQSNNFNFSLCPLVSAIVHSIFACDRHFSHAGIAHRSTDRPIDQTWTSAWSATCVPAQDARTPWDRTSVSRRRPSNARPTRPARRATNGTRVQVFAEVSTHFLSAHINYCINNYYLSKKIREELPFLWKKQAFSCAKELWK